MQSHEDGPSPFLHLVCYSFHKCCQVHLKRARRMKRLLQSRLLLSLNCTYLRSVIIRHHAVARGINKSVSLSKKVLLFISTNRCKVKMAKAKKTKTVKQPVRPVKPTLAASTIIAPPSKLIAEFIHRLQHWKLRAPRSVVASVPSRKRKRSEGSASLELSTVYQTPWVGDKLLDSLRPLLARLRRERSPLPSVERQPRGDLVAAHPGTTLHEDIDIAPLKLLNPTANDFDFGKDVTLESPTSLQLLESDLTHVAAALRSHRIALFEEVKLHHHAETWRSQKRHGAPEPQLPIDRGGSYSEAFDREVLAQRDTIIKPSNPTSGIRKIFKAHTEAHTILFRQLRYGKMTLAELEAAVARSEDQIRAENGLPRMPRAEVETLSKVEAKDQDQRTGRENQDTIDLSNEGGGVKLSKEQAEAKPKQRADQVDIVDNPKNGQKAAHPADAVGLEKVSVPDTENSATDGKPKKARRRQQKKAERKAAQEQREISHDGQLQPETSGVVTRNTNYQPNTQAPLYRPPRELGLNGLRQKALESRGTTRDQAQQRNLERQVSPLNLGPDKLVDQRPRQEATRFAPRPSADTTTIDLTGDFPKNDARSQQPALDHRKQTRPMAQQEQAYKADYEQGMAKDFMPSIGGYPDARARQAAPSNFPNMASLTLGTEQQAHAGSGPQAWDARYGQIYNQPSYPAYGAQPSYPQYVPYPQNGRMPRLPGHYNPAFAFSGMSQRVPSYAPITPQFSSPHHYHTRSVAKANSITPSGSERSTPRRSLSPHSRSVNPPREPFPTAAYRLQALQPAQKAPKPQPLLIISDLNGALILRKARSKTVYTERPALSGFLAHLFARGTAAYDWRQQNDAKPPAHKFMIWTSATPQTTTSVTASLLTKEEKANTIAIWARDRLGLNARQYNAKVQVYKKMESVWGDEGIQKAHPLYDRGERWSQRNTLLIDDSVLKATSQPFNLINVPELTEELIVDETSTTKIPVLGQVAAYIEEASQFEDVSAWARINPFVVDGKWSENRAYDFERNVAQVDTEDT